MKSTLYSWAMSDFIKGLIVAVASPVVPIIISSLNNHTLKFDWYLIGSVSLGAFSGYMAKNFFTDTTKEAIRNLSKQNVTIIEHPPETNIH